MQRIHLVLGATCLALGLVGAAQAGERGFLSHSWGITSSPSAQEPSDDPAWRGYTGRRRLSTEAPWAGSESATQLNDGEPDFHRARPLDPQNPWGEGIVTPSVPALVRGPVESNPF